MSGSRKASETPSTPASSASKGSLSATSGEALSHGASSGSVSRGAPGTTPEPGAQSGAARGSAGQPAPTTLGALRGTRWEQVAGRSVKSELRDNVIRRLQANEELFPGVLGYEESVTPAVVNALLSRHNFILLGLRGQAKTRILRLLTELLDPYIPYIDGTELHDDPFAPITLEGQEVVAECGENTPVAWLPSAKRYLEKLATPDVTVADIIGDIDPIRAAQLGTHLGDPRAVHYGLLPRANRGIFAMNELPDLSGKVQVALFNIMQEGDVQIKGYPLRLPLDVLLVFSANPEDYTARGKIITPLKDRIGSEIRTHYPETIQEGMSITQQEAWAQRNAETQVLLPTYVAEAVEEVAFQARNDSRVDKHSGVSQRLPISLLENVISNAERRALTLGHKQPVARITDLYQALPSITGKIELEYEGELKGADQVAREIIRRAIGQVFARRGAELQTDELIDYFEADNHLRLPNTADPQQIVEIAAEVPGLLTAARSIAEGQETEQLAAALEFVLEGLHGRKLIARSEERGYAAAEPDPRTAPTRRWN